MSIPQEQIPNYTIGVGTYTYLIRHRSRDLHNNKIDSFLNIFVGQPYYIKLFLYIVYNGARIF